MDDVELKALAYVLARQMKEYHHRMEVYLGVLQVIKDSGNPRVDELVKDAMQSAYIKDRTDQAFAFLDKWLPPDHGIELEEARRQWLEKWESGGKKPN